jgi:alpha/beta superfamily hydrolase
MGFDSIGSIVLVVIAILVFWGLVPDRARMAVERARKHEADRFSTSLHLVSIDNGSIIQGVRGTTMPQAVKQLSREKIEEIRGRRRASIRRRQFVVAGLLAVTVALIVCAVIFEFSLAWALIPVALLGVVLFFGAKASKVARKWESSLAGASTTDPSGASRTDAARADAARAQAITVATPDSATLSPQAHEVLETAPTYVIPVDDVREVLRKQAQDKAAAIAKRGSEHRHNDERDERALQADADSSAAAADSGEAPAVADAEVVEADDSTAAVDVVAKVTTEASDKDLISFSFGAESTDAVDAVKSAEIKSYRQVARATPLPGVERNDVSDALLDAVEPPAQSVDSLGVDVDAVIARRQH